MSNVIADFNEENVMVYPTKRNKRNTTVS